MRGLFRFLKTIFIELLIWLVMYVTIYSSTKVQPLLLPQIAKQQFSLSTSPHLQILSLQWTLVSLTYSTICPSFPIFLHVLVRYTSWHTTESLNLMLWIPSAIPPSNLLKLQKCSGLATGLSVNFASAHEMYWISRSQFFNAGKQEVFQFKHHTISSIPHWPCCIFAKPFSPQRSPQLFLMIQ